MNRDIENLIDDGPSEEELESLDHMLDEFNQHATGRGKSQPINLVIRDDHGRMIAGLKGLTVFDWLYIGTLWVHQRHRGKGYGAALVTDAEERARDRRCIGSCLTSFSFQAPEFYFALGYHSVGQINDYPIGEYLGFLVKQFDRD